jgi:alkylation response protein AidB-like acyl-CoA dehydrogenase
MHFLPTPDQLELQRGVRDVLSSAFPLERLEGGWTESLWQVLTDTGVFSLRTELDLGLVEAVLVFEELGRACVPGPLVASFLLAGDGAGPVTVLDAQTHPLLVAHLDVSRNVLVISGETSAVVAAADVTGEPVPQPLDPLTPLTELATVPTGTAYGDPHRLRREGALLTAALQLGLAARMTELAVDYAKSRQQFGRVIGSFQAVKHICADMFVRAELARAAVHAAAVTLDDAGVGDPARAVAGAKLLADEAATGNARGCVQVHGGMGFTWDVPVHYFVKRAWVHATEFGTGDDHAEAVAACLVGAT